METDSGGPPAVAHRPEAPDGFNIGFNDGLAAGQILHDAHVHIIRRRHGAVPDHWAAVALWFTFYNFCRVHKSLRVTPAMEAGISNHVWSVRELLEAA